MTATEAPLEAISVREAQPAGRHRASRWHVPGHLEFRPDIEGLRAVAVLLVVLGHAGVGLFSGGYVGVDVFFVISGFLITSLLLKEQSRTGRISISGFYARRLVRLLPASTVVLVVTLIGAWLWLSPLRFKHIAGDAIASAGYLINFRLAADGTDYFASAAAPSPLQHFWSLAVEEQFYLIWPVTIIVTALVAKRLGRATRPVVAAVLVAIVAVSFALSIVETQRSAPWAYFGSHTRAWELGVGALLAAMGGVKRLQGSRVLASATSWVGLGAIGIAAVVYTDSTPFPGVAALLPVLGAAMVLAGGGQAGDIGAARLLGTAPFQFVGGLSYGLYLWHWPVLLIGAAVLPAGDTLLVKLGLCVVAVLLAWLSLFRLENPLRRLRALRMRPRRGIAFGVSLSAAAAVVAAAVAVAYLPPVRYGPAATDVNEAIAAASDPVAAQRRLVIESTTRATLPANLMPTLADALADQPDSYGDGCHLQIGDVAPPGPCAYGDLNASTTVVLFGDSHAAQWLPTLTRLATLHHWRVLSRTKSSCNPADVRLMSVVLKREYSECDEWRQNTLAEIAQTAPSLVVVAAMFDDAALAEGGGTSADVERTWESGWTRTLASIAQHAERSVLMADTPYEGRDIPDCAATHQTRLNECAVPRAAALLLPGRRGGIAAAATRLNVAVVDPVDWMCSDACPAVVGNLLVYRDAHHLTTAYATMLAPLLDRALATTDR